MPTIRIDDDVYTWLQSHVSTFEDTPNGVLRRIAGLDGAGSDEALSGKTLNRRWGVGAIHALYHKDGTFYEELKQFPGALFDRNGYVLFKTKTDYDAARGLRHGAKLNVPGGISSLIGYQRRRK
jgi:hypothetical protein